MAEEAESENVRLFALNLIVERATGEPKDFDSNESSGAGIDLANPRIATLPR